MSSWRKYRRCPPGCFLSRLPEVAYPAMRGQTADVVSDVGHGDEGGVSLVARFGEFISR